MVSLCVTISTFSYMHIPDTWNHKKHKRSRCDHPRNITGLESEVSRVRRELGRARAHVVEDVEIGIQRVSSGHGSTIVGDLDGIVERVQVDAVHDERHLGGFQLFAQFEVVTDGRKVLREGRKIEVEDLQFT
jgi:hypothetical protein